MKRFCYTLDLKDDSKLKDEYIMHHKNVWPKIIESIKESGIIKAQIYNIGNRLFLLIDTNDEFTEENKKKIRFKKSNCTEMGNIDVKLSKRNRIL